ncbi:MAG: AAA family ATPase [Candidatus Dormibacteria bacterium]|jgi:chromosome partitioning protein
MGIGIACVSGKGGVGKTTTAINLAAALAERGHRVLTVDCDPQSNLTSGLGQNPYELKASLGDLLSGRVTASQAIIATEWPNLHLLPATPDLTAVEAELPSGLHRETLLRDALDRDGTCADYDFVFYDTPPNFGVHTVNALAATDYVIIPLQMSGFAVRGLKEVLRAVHLARSRLNPELRVLGLVPTFVNIRTNFSRQLLNGLAELAGLRVFETLIAPTVKLQETSLAGVPIIAYAPASKAAAAYRELAGEVLTVV